MEGGCNAEKEKRRGCRGAEVERGISQLVFAGCGSGIVKASTTAIFVVVVSDRQKPTARRRTELNPLSFYPPIRASSVVQLAFYSAMLSLFELELNISPPQRHKNIPPTLHISLADSHTPFSLSLSLFGLSIHSFA